MTCQNTVSAKYAYNQTQINKQIIYIDKENGDQRKESYRWAWEQWFLYMLVSPFYLVQEGLQ